MPTIWVYFSFRDVLSPLPIVMGVNPSLQAIEATARKWLAKHHSWAELDYVVLKDKDGNLVGPDILKGDLSPLHTAQLDVYTVAIAKKLNATGTASAGRW